MEYVKDKDLAGILVAIDVEKAFDTLNLNFLIRTLRKFIFGPSFIQLIRTLYKNVKRLCNEQWFYNRPLHIKQRSSPRQSTFTVSLLHALEILTIKIRNDDSIKVFKIGGETTKLSLFADDITCFV